MSEPNFVVGRWPGDLRATTYEKSAGVITYIDGMKNGELSSSNSFTLLNDAKKFYLGLKPTGLLSRFAGKLDEVKVYNVALSEEQVRLAMRAEMNPGSAVLPKTAESDVEIATLTLKMSDAGSATPLLTTSGKVALAASGTCMIEGAAKASDLDGCEWAIAKGASVSLPTGVTGWTIDPAPTLGYKFLVRGDTLYLKVKAPGLTILVR